MTDFRRGPTPRESKPTPSQKFLEDQQKELFKSVQEELEDKKATEEKKKAAERLKPFYMEARQSVREPEGTKTTIIPEFVTESGYKEDIRDREKVGSIPTFIFKTRFDSCSGSSS